MDEEAVVPRSTTALVSVNNKFAFMFHHGWEATGRTAAKTPLGCRSHFEFSSELAYISGTEVYQ